MRNKLYVVVRRRSVEVSRYFGAMRLALRGVQAPLAALPEETPRERGYADDIDPEAGNRTG